MSDYFKQITPKQSLLVVINEFEEQVVYNQAMTRHLDYQIWSSAPFELLGIYFCFNSFFNVNVVKSISDFAIDGDTDVLLLANQKTFNHPWTILPEMMLQMTPNAIEQAQILYTEQRMSFKLNVNNTIGFPFTENTRWHLIFRATTAQQFKINVTQTET